MKILSRVVALALALAPAMLQAQTVAITGHPSSAAVSAMATILATSMKEQGAAGTAGAIHQCYAQGGQPPDLMLLANCILWDAAAVKLDVQVRQAAIAQGMSDPGPAAPFLAPQAYTARLALYGRQVFGPDPGAAGRYLGDAPDQVLALMVKRSKP